MLVVTVHVALVNPSLAVTPVMVGVVPVIPVGTNPKSVPATADTGSENVTVHDSGPVFTSCAVPARTMEVTVGVVVS
jgi:hypothetical protein